MNDAVDPLHEVKKILWVEDDEFLQSLIAQRLVSEKYAVFQAVKGEEALALAQREQPNVIMLDLLLPQMDGIEILRRLKANPATSSIPVLIFSNLTDKDRFEQAQKLGVAGFFIKAHMTLDEILVEIKKAADSSAQ
jgi:CheY-like chemotaxis protein